MCFNGLAALEEGREGGREGGREVPVVQGKLVLPQTVVSARRRELCVGVC